MSDWETSTLPLKIQDLADMPSMSPSTEEINNAFIKLSRNRLVSPFGIQAFMARKKGCFLEANSYKQTDLNEALLISLYLGDVRTSRELLNLGAKATRNTVYCICRYQKSTTGLKCLLSSNGLQSITYLFFREAALNEHWEVLKFLLEFTQEDNYYVSRVLHRLFTTKPRSFIFWVDYFFFTDLVYLSIGSNGAANLACLQSKYEDFWKKASNDANFVEKLVEAALNTGNSATLACTIKELKTCSHEKAVVFLYRAAAFEKETDCTQQVIEHLQKLKYSYQQTHLDTALLYACLANKVHTCDFLLSIGANARAQYDFMLRAALLTPNIAMAYWALRKGCRIESIEGHLFQFLNSISESCLQIKNILSDGEILESLGYCSFCSASGSDLSSHPEKWVGLLSRMDRSTIDAFKAIKCSMYKDFYRGELDFLKSSYFF